MDEFLNEVLLESAKDGNLIVLKTALEKGADINAKNSDGKTSLMVAIEIGHSELVEYLTEKGADISIDKKPKEIKSEKLEDTPNPNWKIIFGRTGQGIMMINADGTGLTSLLDWGEMPYVSSDGMKIIFSAYPYKSEQGLVKSQGIYNFSLPEIHIMDVNGTSIKRLTFSEEMGSSFPKFSQNGKKIGFKRTKESKSQIWIMDIDGKKLEQLTYEESVGHFCWILNNRIVFETRNGEKFITDYKDRNLERLTIFEEDEYEPVWNSDGENIAFLKGMDLFVMDKEGKNRQCLIDIRGWIGNWSPDGQWIVFSSRKMNGNGADIFIIRKDGKHECRLTDLIIKDGKPGGDFDPCWLL